MVDLNKLSNMLNEALAAETTESLNRWIDDQEAADLADGTIRETGFGGLNVYYSPIDKAVIEKGMSEIISYSKVVISESFDSLVSNEYNFVA